MKAKFYYRRIAAVLATLAALFLSSGAGAKWY
jgi:hypothetical protein